MGCDIHAAIEKKIDDQWIMVTRLSNKSGLNRNYERFAKLAGVRRNGPSPKGIPIDISDGTKLYIVEWGDDGHSHSFLELTEAANLFLETEWEGKKLDNWIIEYPVSHYFDIELESYPGEYRLIFWFDN